MKSIYQRVTSAAALAVVLGGTLSSARAQSPASAGNPLPAAAASPKNLSALAFTKTPVAKIAARLARDSGATIVTDTGIASIPIDFSTIGGSLESVLAQLSKVLPPSGSVRAVLVPIGTTAGTDPEGNAVAAYVKAQDDFVAIGAPAVTAKAGTPAPVAPYVPGQFELLGQHIPVDRAAALSVDLHLRTVYLLKLNRPPDNPVAKLGQLQAEGLREWQGMTADQRREAMEQQFGDMMNMDKGAREQLLGQMMDQGAYMMGMMKSMPPAQLQEFQQEMTTAMQNSGILPKGGPGK